MATQRLGIIMNGVTGRMGLNQHLVRSIVAIRKQGGVLLSNGDRVMPDPILVGRNAEKVAALARQYGIERSTSDLDAALKNPDDTVFFDAATTQMRTDLQTEYGPQGVASASGAWLVQDWHFERTAASNGPDRIRECSVARSGEQFEYRAGCGIAVRADIRRAVHRQDAVERQRVVQDGEDRLLDLSGVFTARDQHELPAVVDVNRRFGP